MIAASGQVTVSGTIAAEGVLRQYNYFYLHNLTSAGGAIKIIANQLLGDGTISAARTRVEANTVSQQINLNPNTAAVPPGTVPIIWPADSAPTVTVLGVNSQSVPADPRAGVLTTSDVTIQTNAPVDVSLQARNFPPSGSVVLRVNPKYGNFYTVNASFVSGVFTQSLWKATTTLPNGFCTLQAHATSP